MKISYVCGRYRSPEREKGESSTVSLYLKKNSALKFLFPKSSGNYFRPPERLFWWLDIQEMAVFCSTCFTLAQNKEWESLN